MSSRSFEPQFANASLASYLYIIKEIRKVKDDDNVNQYQGNAAILDRLKHISPVVSL